MEKETRQTQSKQSTGRRKQPRDFWQRLTAGMELQELWAQFKTDTQVSYGLYSQEVDWDSIRDRDGWKRPLLALRVLFGAMLGKLSPTRRLWLLASLLLALCALLDLHFVWLHPVVLYLLAFVSLVVLLALELADRVAMKRDLEIAREIQTWLVPDEPPTVPGYGIAFDTQPANTVCGDYYDALWRPQGTGDQNSLLLVVGDVAGKSVPAALLMASFQASLHTLSPAVMPLDELVSGLNRFSCARSLHGRRFTTAFLAELEPESGRLTYISAGHNAPILRRKSGGVERLEVGGLPLGIKEDERYPYASVDLAPGDLLLIFTDGVTDAHDEFGQEFGERRLLECVTALPATLAATEILVRLQQRIRTFVANAPKLDDVTWFVLRVDP